MAKRSSGVGEAARLSDRIGIKSVEVGARLLVALSERSTPISLKDLAATCRMSPSKAHRYLISYERLGLVKQDKVSRLYGLGNFALKMGLSAIERADALKQAMEVQTQLRDRLGQTIVLSVWTSFGPAVWRVEESPGPVVVTTRVGVYLPLLRTAAGRVCAAFRPWHLVRPFVEAELDAARIRGDRILAPLTVEQVMRRKVETRRRRLSRNQNSLLTNVNSIATPLLDHEGELIATLAVIGQSQEIDIDWEGPVAKALLDSAVQFNATSTSIVAVRSANIPADQTVKSTRR